MTRNLYTAVTHLANAAHALTDADLGQPFTWGKHDEGIRLALLGTTQELRQLAVQLTQERTAKELSVTAVQRLLAQNHAGFRDLEAVLLGVSDEQYSQEPAPGEWPLRYVLGHIVGAERRFLSLAQTGVTHHRAGEAPPPLPDDAPETIIGPYADFRAIMEEGTLAEMLTYFRAMHFRSWELFGGLTDAELAAPSPLWWEEETYAVQYRLHRFDAHLRQHLLQAIKTLAQLGQPQTEASRLVRLLYNALAEVEALTIGAPDVGAVAQTALAQIIEQRTADITAVIQQTRALETAVKSSDLPTVQNILQQAPRLVNALDQSRLSLVLTAVYHNQPAIARALGDAGAELSIFSAAATGSLEKVQAHVAEWDGWLQEFNTDGYTALQLACFFGHEATALWLIEQNADVNAIARNHMKITPVHAAAANGNLTVLRALLTKAADVNAQQQGGFTALHEAARTNNVALAQLCLEFGADFHVTTDDGQTPLALAQTNNSLDVIPLLN
ncbi:MAG: ankyrin repeat domain-containing protein [Anaerolineae bacterium]|nr:ankyrin repeat domain-containing protein [Anaerolineae bacterium]